MTLEGTVEWQFQRRAAERAVRRLTGVRGVTNLITVKPGSTAEPVGASSAGSRTRWSAMRRPTPTDEVKVKGGKVTLAGTAAWAERQAAERVAWSAPGVTEAVDRITVHF